MAQFLSHDTEMNLAFNVNFLNKHITPILNSVFLA